MMQTRHKQDRTDLARAFGALAVAMLDDGKQIYKRDISHILQGLGGGGGNIADRLSAEVQRTKAK